MTPLAHQLTKTLTLPPKKRGWWRDQGRSDLLRSLVTDIHCFEVSAIRGAVDDLSRQTMRMFRAGEGTKATDLFSRYTFLPAPRTWIEYIEDRDPISPPYRVAHLLEGDAEKEITLSLFVEEDNARFNHIEPYYHLGEYCLNHPLFMHPNPLLPSQVTGVHYFDRVVMTMSLTLILINSPKIFGRRQVMPHLGLEKRVTRTFGKGKFPLHAWTEIKLEVAKPAHIDDGEPHEAHLTGRRALHFCRKHIRIRFGRLEYVTAHWRGDPAIGIKRSRYKVRPPRTDTHLHDRPEGA